MVMNLWGQGEKLWLPVMYSGWWDGSVYKGMDWQA